MQLTPSDSVHRPKPYTLPNGLQVYGLSRTDTNLVYQEIFEEDVYRQHGVKIEDGDCIFDVGANTGLFAVFLNQICRRLAVYAFEPIPAICEVLQWNVELHDKLDVKVLNIGLSREQSMATFSYFPRLSCASTMYPDDSDEEEQRARRYILDQFGQLPNRPLRLLLKLMPPPLRRALAGIVRKHFAKTQQITCTLRTVSDLIEEYQIDRVDLLKLDAERSELDVLAGIEHRDWPKIRQAVIEVHEGEEPKRAVEDQLARHGFHVEADRNPHFPHIYMLYAVRPED